ncbi:18752_t:CDS:1 [Gigaspora rosea]|nr:18752_t:CDS:1 [Gigaspora rosea]
MKINDEARRLKVENSKLFFQYACAETSLTKYKAEYYAKSEEVKSLQFVINSFPPGYFDKNNQPDGPERTDSYAKSGGEKNNEPESSSASSEQIIPVTICKEKISLGGSGNSIDIDKLLSSVFTCSILLFSINHNYIVSCCEKAMEFGEHHAKRKSQISRPQKIYK